MAPRKSRKRSKNPVQSNPLPNKRRKGNDDTVNVDEENIDPNEVAFKSIVDIST